MKMYYVAVVAPHQINNDVLKWKNYMRDHYGCKVALRSPAHVTLIAPFWMNETQEQELINVIYSSITSTPAFDIRLKDFGSFPPRVIYINVEPNAALNALKEKLENSLVVSGKFKIEKEQRPYHPHLTIATRDLHKAAYKEAIAMFSTKKYNATWNVSSVTLLKHDKQKWEVREEIPF